MFISPTQEIEYFSAALESMDDTAFSNLCSQVIPIVGDGSVPMCPPAQHDPAVTSLHQGGQQTQANGLPPYMNRLDTLISLALLGQAINAQAGTAGRGQSTGGNLPATTSITATQAITTLHTRPSTIVRSSNSWILFRADRKVMVRAFNLPAALVDTLSLRLVVRRLVLRSQPNSSIPLPLSPSLRHSRCALRSSPATVPILTSSQSMMLRGYNMGAHYRIGPIEDEAGLNETCGNLVMGRGRDALVANPKLPPPTSATVA